MVRISTRVPAVAGSAQIRRVASIPSISGIRTSISTTSGRCCSASATASHAVAGLADGGAVRAEVDQHPEAAAQQRLVVGDQHPDHAATR